MLRRGSVLLDICCGTGTIGLLHSRFFHHIVGIELSESAIEDAKINAGINSVDNATFICSKAETAIQSVLEQLALSSAGRWAHSASSLSASADYKVAAVIPKVSLPTDGSVGLPVGIVDPPRAGLHPDVLRALRNSRLTRVVYVSCNPETLSENLKRLMAPSTTKFRGPPFTPLAAVAVDMFPHTEHCEMIVLLERPAFGGGGKKGGQADDNDDEAGLEDEEEGDAAAEDQVGSSGAQNQNQTWG